MSFCSHSANTPHPLAVTVHTSTWCLLMLWVTWPTPADPRVAQQFAPSWTTVRVNGPGFPADRFWVRIRINAVCSVPHAVSSRLLVLLDSRVCGRQTCQLWQHHTYPAQICSPHREWVSVSCEVNTCNLKHFISCLWSLWSDSCAWSCFVSRFRHKVRKPSI